MHSCVFYFYFWFTMTLALRRKKRQSLGRAIGAVSLLCIACSIVSQISGTSRFASYISHRDDEYGLLPHNVIDASLNNDGNSTINAGISIVSFEEKYDNKQSGVDALTYQAPSEHSIAIPPINVTTNTSSTAEIVQNASTMAKPYKFAYTFLVAGCIPQDPSYLGFLYNILVSKELFSTYNSTADVVVLIRMHASVDDDVLPEDHISMLHKLGVKVKYIPKPKLDNFHTAMMDKFRVLELEEYDRVIYLDSDIIPLNNLDFIFEKSVGPNATLQENLILAHSREPANGGFFMLKPGKGEYDELRKIVAPMEVPGYKFDVNKGFGHTIVKPDCWQSFWTCQRRWTFYGAFTDQGLLYHWTKYVKKNVTQLVKHDALIFREDQSGNVTMAARVKKATLFQNVKEYGHLRTKDPSLIKDMGRVYTDFMHFYLKSKPWLQPPTAHFETMNETTTPWELWYFVLREINKKYDLKINTESMNITQTLGHVPTIDMLKIMDRI